jgi:hypothetical protein
MDKLRVQRCRGDAKGWFIVFTGSEAEAVAEYEKQKAEIKKGGVRVLEPNGHIKLMYWVPPTIKKPPGRWKR